MQYLDMLMLLICKSKLPLEPSISFVAENVLSKIRIVPQTGLVVQGHKIHTTFLKPDQGKNGYGGVLSGSL